MMRTVTHRSSHHSRTRHALHCIGMNLAIGLSCILVLVQIVRPIICRAASVAGGKSETAIPSIETVTYDSGGTQIRAFLVRPEGTGKYPSVIVIHDSQGLTSEFRDIARQLAASGFVALVPDLLSRAGGTQDPLQAESETASLRPQVTVEDLRAAFTYLQNDPSVDPEKISSIGFGWGGWRSFKLATTLPGLRHAVIFYGATPIDGLQNVHASVLANYAQYDFFDTGNSIWTGDTLKQAGAKFVYYIYPKTFRGFIDPDNPHYDSDAAKLAWSRTLEFLRS